jgi:hypothetical protein
MHRLGVSWIEKSCVTMVQAHGQSKFGFIGITLDQIQEHAGKLIATSLVQYRNDVSDKLRYETFAKKLKSNFGAERFERCDFKPSLHWVEGFIARHKRSIRLTKQSSMTKARQDTLMVQLMHNYFTDFNKWCKELGFKLVYNCDETMIAGSNRKEFTEKIRKVLVDANVFADPNVNEPKFSNSMTMLQFISEEKIGESIICFPTGNTLPAGAADGFVRQVRFHIERHWLLQEQDVH